MGTEFYCPDCDTPKGSREEWEDDPCCDDQVIARQSKRITALKAALCEAIGMIAEDRQDQADNESVSALDRLRKVARDGALDS